MTDLLLVTLAFLAYSNGANDNFKGVASLFGSRTTTYRTALAWGTATTAVGSICAFFVAQALLAKFSGKGVVPDALVGSQVFVLAIALSAGLTVILATRLGFPVSTTHGLTGAMLGAGVVAVGGDVKFGALGCQFVLPLLLSPVLAVLLGGALYAGLHFARLRLGITKESCICVAAEQLRVALASSPTSSPCTSQSTVVSVALDSEDHCSKRYGGALLGINCQRAMDAAHFLSAGIVSFARGLNDTPKIAALLLVVQALDIRLGIILVAVTMAIGGLLGSRRVAETMSNKITRMNHGQGFSANAATGILVLFASLYGLPVSTTHVSVGALYGIGLSTGQADSRTMLNILLSWVLILPCAGILGGAAFWLCRQFAV